MYRTQKVVALVALCVGLANSLSWDYVVTTNTTLEFYNNETLTHSEDFEFGIKYLTHDAVQNRLLFLERENTRNIFIHSLDLATMERQLFFMIRLKNDSDYIHSLAYDPFTELVYFTDSKDIFWYSLKPGFKNNFNGNVLIESQSPSTVYFAIAVDSCKGYIYWVARAGKFSGIMWARLSGSDIELLFMSGTGGYNYLVIDQQTQNLYFIDEYIDRFKRDVVQFNIHVRDLNEKMRTRVGFMFSHETDIHYIHSQTNSTKHSTKALTISKDFIHWMDWKSRVWKLDKYTYNPFITNIFSSSHNSILENYKIEDQTEDVEDCEALVSNSVSNGDSLNVPINENLVCHNFCIQGNCTVIEGQAICRCNAGYSGDRCTLNICQGYCLNDDDCYLNENSEPVCQCKGDYSGERCAVSGFLKKCYQTVSLLKDILSTDVTPVALDYGVNSTCAK